MDERPDVIAVLRFLLKRLTDCPYRAVCRLCQRVYLRLSVALHEQLQYIDCAGFQILSVERAYVAAVAVDCAGRFVNLLRGLIARVHRREEECAVCEDGRLHRIQTVRQLEKGCLISCFAFRLRCAVCSGGLRIAVRLGTGF